MINLKSLLAIWLKKLIILCNSHCVASFNISFFNYVLHTVTSFFMNSKIFSVIHFCFVFCPTLGIYSTATSVMATLNFTHCWSTFSDFKFILNSHRYFSLRVCLAEFTYYNVIVWFQLLSPGLFHVTVVAPFLAPDSHKTFLCHHHY